MKSILAAWMGLALLTSCSQPAVKTAVTKEQNQLAVYGRWITEPDGTVMLDPQPSGLIHWRDKLVTLSDRSAIPIQRLRLRPIDPQTAALVDNGFKMVLSASVAQGCFGPYVGNNPDLESLVGDPDDDRVFYIITEDGSDAEPMPESCKIKYQNTGSTDYPNLLVRLELRADQTVEMTHIRPLQYASEFQVGNSPNDGIEAMAFGANRTLYLGLEKDSKKQARIFSLNMTADFWQRDDFAPVSEPSLKLPTFSRGNHPINGMDYYQTSTGEDFLIAAARNDSSLWIIDLSGNKDTKILPMEFYAQLNTSTDNCQDWEKMDNASIEGVAVVKETLWMVNDPWKEVYPRNIICAQNKSNYQNYSPLLFSVAIQTEWFQ